VLAASIIRALIKPCLNQFEIWEPFRQGRTLADLWGRGCRFYENKGANGRRADHILARMGRGKQTQFGHAREGG
jgi:hypothetical protein